MKKKDIKKLSKTEILKNLDNLKKDLFNLRFRKVNGQIEDSSKFSLIKRDIAKLLTQLKKKKND